MTATNELNIVENEAMTMDSDRNNFLCFFKLTSILQTGKRFGTALKYTSTVSVLRLHRGNESALNICMRELLFRENDRCVCVQNLLLPNPEVDGRKEARRL